MFKLAFKMAEQLIAPHLCPACVAEVADRGLCSNCWVGLKLISSQACGQCGMPFDIPQIDPLTGQVCGQCLIDPPDFDHAVSALVYADPARRMILALKHGDRQDIAPILARIMAPKTMPLIEAADLILPLPLHRSRFFKRRFNQSAELTRQILALHGGGNSFTHVDFGVTNTLDFADPYTVDYPSDAVPITFPDPIPDPVVELDDYNYIEGTNNSDSFNGTEEADRFYNLRSGRDHVRGNGGNDLIESGGGYDTFNGGSGSDTVSYANANSYVIAHLGQGRANIKNSGLGTNERDTLISIENIIGSDFGDQLTGSNGNNQVEGGAGDDRVHGGFGGRNILYGGAGDDTLISASEANSHNTLIGGANADTFVIGQQDNVVDIIRDFTPDDGDEIKFLIGNGANKNSLDAVFNDSYVNHVSTRFEDYTGNGKLDTVMTFDINNFSSGQYTLILEGFTAPLLIDYISVEVDA